MAASGFASVDGFGLRLKHRGRAVHTGDLDPAGFQRLGRLADKVDMQHPVLMHGTGDADMVGQREACLLYTSDAADE